MPIRPWPYSRPCLPHTAFDGLREPALLLPAFGSIPVVSCGERNLKGSGINKRKANQTKLQQDFGRHAGSGALCTHKELSVSLVVLHIPVEYSLSHTLARTHATITDTWGGEIHKDKVDLRGLVFCFSLFVVHTFVLCFWSHPSSFLWNCCMGFCCKNCFDMEPETRLNQNELVYPPLLGEESRTFQRWWISGIVSVRLFF